MNFHLICFLSFLFLYGRIEYFYKPTFHICVNNVNNFIFSFVEFCKKKYMYSVEQCLAIKVVLKKSVLIKFSRDNYTSKIVFEFQLIISILIYKKKKILMFGLMWITKRHEFLFINKSTNDRLQKHLAPFHISSNIIFFWIHVLQ